MRPLHGPGLSAAASSSSLPFSFASLSRVVAEREHGCAGASREQHSGAGRGAAVAAARLPLAPPRPPRGRVAPRGADAGGEGGGGGGGGDGGEGER
eukprot:2622216-Rhodomonas_salina.1